MDIKQLTAKHSTKQIDKKFINQLYTYKVMVMSKTEENMEWFNSFYFGVHKIRFTDNDKENLYLLLDIDEMELVSDIKRLGGLKSNWNVVTDPFNVACSLYLRKILESDLNKELKEKAFTDLMIIFQFKMMTSIYYNFFKYQVTKDIATTVYEKLPRKFIIKKLGSNYKVLEHNAVNRFNSTNWTNVLKKNKPIKFIYFISNLNTTLKSFIIQQYDVLVQVLEEDSLRTTTSPTTRDSETGEERIKDVNDIHNVYIANIQRKLFIKDEFIDRGLLELVSEMFPKLKIDAIEKTLIYLQESAYKDKDIVTMCLKIIEINNRYLYIEKLFPPYADRLLSVFKFLKNYWSSSSLKDKDMQEVKTKIIKIVKDVTGIKTKGILSSTTIIVAVYIYTIAITDIKR